MKFEELEKHFIKESIDEMRNDNFKMYNLIKRTLNLKTFLVNSIISLVTIWAICVTREEFIGFGMCLFIYSALYIGDIVANAITYKTEKYKGKC